MEWIQRNVLRLTDDDMKEMRKQIDAEKAAGLIMDPMQIAQQGQQELMNPDGAGGAPAAAPAGGDAGGAPAPAQDSAPVKGDLSLNNDYTPSMRMLQRVL
jgi:hypothetical protein